MHAEHIANPLLSLVIIMCLLNGYASITRWARMSRCVGCMHTHANGKEDPLATTGDNTKSGTDVRAGGGSTSNQRGEVFGEVPIGAMGPSCLAGGLALPMRR